MMVSNNRRRKVILYDYSGRKIFHVHNISYGTADTKITAMNAPKAFLCISVVKMLRVRMYKAPDGDLEAENTKQS